MPAARRVGGPIRWRVKLRSPRERVFAALDTADGRASFWAESAEASDDHISFRFINGMEYRGRVLERSAPSRLSLDYFGAVATFELEARTDGGTDLTLTHEGVEKEDWIEVHAGWLNVLFPLKAYVDHGVDLRSHDSERTWHKGFIDQ